MLFAPVPWAWLHFKEVTCVCFPHWENSRSRNLAGFLPPTPWTQWGTVNEEKDIKGESLVQSKSSCKWLSEQMRSFQDQLERQGTPLRPHVFLRSLRTPSFDQKKKKNLWSVIGNKHNWVADFLGWLLVRQQFCFYILGSEASSQFNVRQTASLLSRVCRTPWRSGGGHG